MENKIDIFDILDNYSDKKEARSYSFKYTPVNYVTYKYLFRIKFEEKKYNTHSFTYKIKKDIKSI